MESPSLVSRSRDPVNPSAARSSSGGAASLAKSEVTTSDLCCSSNLTGNCLGLFPFANFYQTTVPTGDCGTDGSSQIVTDVAWQSVPLAQAVWYFRGETIACPRSGFPVAGFERHLSVWDDLRQWTENVAAAPLAIEYPTLVWLGASHVLDHGRMVADGQRVQMSSGELGLVLAPRLASNRSYFNADSLAFFQSRDLRLRGFHHAGTFEARVFWPCDWRLDPAATLAPIAADANAIRAWVRSAGSVPGEGFSTRLLWQRGANSAASHAENAERAGRPLFGLMLNGAQGDDDEAHGGHFGMLTGYVGPQGETHDWLMANFYTLDSESEKGILSAMLPLDSYLADLNSGQSWYRPSWLLVATLREERTASRLSSALARVFQQFYRHQFLYRHATDNCAGICLSILRTLGWQVPALGVSGYLKALLAFFVVSVRQRSFAKGRAMFDYFSEERTRLFPALAFEQASVDLLKIVSGRVARQLTPFEAMLRDDVDEILLVHLPQLPSSRVAGSFPVASIEEYQARLPRNPEDQQIIPVAPRPFPAALKDPLAPAGSTLCSPLRSACVLAGLGIAGGLIAGALFIARWAHV